MIIGISVFILIILLIYESPSLLEKRFANTIIKEDNIFAKFINTLQRKMRKVSQKNARTANYMSQSRKLLLQAGYASSEEDVIKYDAAKLANVFITGMVLSVFLIISFSLNTVIISILILYLVYRRPEIMLKRKIKFRQKEFMKYLPDAVDLLAICIQAGLSLDAAFEKVAEEFSFTSQTISTEFSRLNKDILSGLSREEAYKNLILRNENSDLQSFIALLIQTDKLGTSITQSLNAFCDSMRTKKRQRIEELSQQASTKMTIPMVLFMLPAIFIIIMYPAIQKIMVSLAR